MSDKIFEYEAMYSIVSRKDFRDELNDFFNTRNSTEAIMNLADFAMTKGVEVLEVDHGKVVLYPHRSNRKRPACVIASQQGYAEDYDCQAYMSTGRWCAFYMEAGKYDVAGSS